MTPYYVEPAAAYVRATRPDLEASDDESTVAQGLEAGVRLQRFKRSRVLPRVRKVLGILHGLDPRELLDLGTGRGVFLWPLLEAFSELPVTCVDHDPERVRQLQAVSRGGVKRLSAVPADATSLAFDDRCFDVVTALEVLEHIEQVDAAVRETVRVGRRFVVASVPSRPDDNPGHVHLLKAEVLARLFERAGAQRVDVDAVHNHLVAVVRLPWTG